MKSQNTKSSNDLKKEVHQELRKVQQDIDEITNCLSPGKIIDDAIFSAHRGPMEAFEYLKKNPIGASFPSLGTILLLEDESHTSYESIAKNRVATGVSFLKGAIQETLQIKVNAMRSGLASKVSDSDELELKKSQVSSKKFAGKEKIKTLDTTTLMALGLGLGALTSGSLPLSDTEEQMISAKFDDKLSDFSHDLKAAINECSNTLKDLFIQDVKDTNVKLF